MQKVILILAANPKDTSRLRLDQEVREISNGLERSQMRDQFVLRQIWAARPVDIRRALLDLQPNIVHFCGHGGSDGVFFEDDKGLAKLVEASTLADFFRLFTDSVECVVLNACYSEIQARAIAEHIPYVVGMPKEISDDAAIEFAVAFYDAIGAGRSYEFAYNVACNALQWSGVQQDYLKPVMIKNRNHPYFAHACHDPLYFKLLKSYRQFIGRESTLSEIAAAISDPGGKWIIGIDGMGGIGKTAIAMEVAEMCLREGLFDNLVWVQSSKSPLSVSDREDSLSQRINYESILNAISWQLGYPFTQKESISAREEQIRILLLKHKTLIVLDNLETSLEPQDSIAERLYTLLKPSKALLTSRHRFKGNVYSIHLGGLTEEESAKLLRQEAEERGITKIRNAPIEELKEIGRVVGGSPLALKLIAGQLGHMPLEAVLGLIRKVEFAQVSYADEYALLYKNIFIPSWDLLSENAKRLLVSMAHLSSDAGGTLEAISFISGFPEIQTFRSLNELWTFSFVEMSESFSLHEVVYYLHPLTQYFVLSDIVGCK